MVSSTGCHARRQARLIQISAQRCCFVVVLLTGRFNFLFRRAILISLQRLVVQLLTLALIL